MVAAAKNYDVLCLQMRNYLPQQESPIQKETLRFLDGVRAIVSAGSPIQPRLDAFIPEVFNFRLLALKWLCSQPDLDLQHLLDNAYQGFESLLGNPRLALLGENIMFAIRCNSRVTKHMLGDSNSEQLADEMGSMPETYDRFWEALEAQSDNEAAIRAFKDFSNASLYIEFILLATCLIDEENILATDETIDELAFLVADAAQNYSALATLFGLVPAKSKMKQPGIVSGSANFDEDQHLANLGLSDFSKLF